ncbi:MAG: transporter [Elusimicrobiales bacterium]|nr:transporter [Elusimicrobiales bacterium]
MKISFAAAVLAVLYFSAPAAAFTHLAGEDTRFLGRDEKQMEGWVDYSVSREGPDRYNTSASAKLTYGLWENLDLMVTVPWHGWNSHGISESGLGDALLEAKFQVAKKQDWALALKPGFSLPAGDEAKSLGAGKGGVWIYGIAGKSLGPWQLYLNAGFVLNRNSLDEKINILKASVAALLKVHPKLLAAAGVDASTNKDKSSSSNPITSVFGLVWSPYPTLDLDAGLRLGLTRAAISEGLVAGLTLRI